MSGSHVVVAMFARVGCVSRPGDGRGNADAIGLGGEILRDARTVLAEGRLSQEVLMKLIERESRMQVIMQEVTRAAGGRAMILHLVHNTTATRDMK